MTGSMCAFVLASQPWQAMGLAALAPNSWMWSVW